MKKKKERKRRRENREREREREREERGKRERERLLKVGGIIRPFLKTGKKMVRGEFRWKRSRFFSARASLFSREMG
jgi:hypothetical protein